MQKIPEIRFNFGGSNQLASRSQSAIGEAGSIFASLNKQRQADAALKQKQEQDAVRNQQIERQQLFAEGANQRALDLKSALLNQERQQRIQDNEISSGVVNSLVDNFSLSDTTRRAVQNDPRFQNLRTSEQVYDENDDLVVKNDTTKQDQILSGLMDNFRQNPNLILDPQEIKRNVIAEANAKGLSDEQTAKQLNNALSSFQTFDPEISKALIEQNGTNQEQIAGLIKSYNKLNGSGGSTGGKSNLKFSSKNARDKYLFDKENILSEYSAERGIVDRVIPGFMDATNVSRENLRPVLDMFSQMGLEAPAVHNALKAHKYISGDGEWEKGTPSEIMNNADIREKIKNSAIAYQGGIAQGAGGGSAPSLSSALGLLRASQDDLQNQNNRILQQSSPRQVSAKERKNLALQYLEEQTGVSLADLEKPTPQQQRNVQRQFINVGKDTGSTKSKPKPKPEPSQNTVSENSTKNGTLKEEFQEYLNSKRITPRNRSILVEGSERNQRAFENFKNRRTKEIANEQKNLDQSIKTVKAMLRRNRFSSERKQELKDRLRALESQKSN